LAIDLTGNSQNKKKRIIAMWGEFNLHYYQRNLYSNEIFFTNQIRNTLFIYLFCGTGVWTQGFTLAKQGSIAWSTPPVKLEIFLTGNTESWQGLRERVLSCYWSLKSIFIKSLESLCASACARSWVQSPNCRNKKLHTFHIKYIFMNQFCKFWPPCYLLITLKRNHLLENTKIN
jgi:hypothetical protein